MALNHGGYGSMAIVIDGLRLDARFLRPSADVDDWFSIDKSMPSTISPKIEIARDANGVRLSWPTSQPPLALHTSDTLLTPTWIPALERIESVGRRNTVTLDATDENRFFRLER